MQTSLRRRHRDRVVRRGLGMIIESDVRACRFTRVPRIAHAHRSRADRRPQQFYATEAGRAHFADQLTSIRYCVQETCSVSHSLNPTPSRRCSRVLRLPQTSTRCTRT